MYCLSVAALYHPFAFAAKILFVVIDIVPDPIVSLFHFH
jgi:hypothetical protein